MYQIDHLLRQKTLQINGTEFGQPKIMFYLQPLIFYQLKLQNQITLQDNGN